MIWGKCGLGSGRRDESLRAWGHRLLDESGELQADIQTAISRSLLTMGDETILPSIAGVKEPFHVAVPRDPTDPQYRSYRAYMEMMYSGILTGQQVQWIVEYRKRHHDLILGVPTAYGFNTGDIAGFLAYGHGYGLIEHDMTREALLTLYGVMAHQYTRGTWTAPETRPVYLEDPAAPYCTPAQLVVTLMTRWMLVFEDPMSDTLWLGKAIPRKWLEEGKTVSASDVPTRWGKVGFSIVSHSRQRTIAATVKMPGNGLQAVIRLRLRAPEGLALKSVEVNGKEWKDFNSVDETVTLPSGVRGPIEVMAKY